MTVGTTKFEKLISEIEKKEFAEALHSLGYTSIRIQVSLSFLPSFFSFLFFIFFFSFLLSSFLNSFLSFFLSSFSLFFIFLPQISMGEEKSPLFVISQKWG